MALSCTCAWAPVARGVAPDRMYVALWVWHMQGRKELFWDFGSTETEGGKFWLSCA